MKPGVHPALVNHWRQLNELSQWREDLPAASRHCGDPFGRSCLGPMADRSALFLFSFKYSDCSVRRQEPAAALQDERACYSSSKTLRITWAKLRRSMGFITNARKPISVAFSLSII